MIMDFNTMCRIIIGTIQEQVGNEDVIVIGREDDGMITCRINGEIVFSGSDVPEAIRGFYQFCRDNDLVPF